MTVKDGWHSIGGYTVYVDGGLVNRGVTGGRPIYPYRVRPDGVWTKDKGMTVAAFRAAVRRDTARMM